MGLAAKPSTQDTIVGASSRRAKGAVESRRASGQKRLGDLGGQCTGTSRAPDGTGSRLPPREPVLPCCGGGKRVRMHGRWGRATW